jgi:homopolymeric O-antigen transport system permease protein
MDSTLPVTRIEPPRRWIELRLGEVFEYRELAAFLVWRDIKVRYKQTVLGFAWAFIQPVMSMTLFTIVFGRIAGLPSDGVPYPLFALAGLLPWQLFAASVNGSSNSMVGAGGLLTKVYFPRLIVPLSASLATLVDFAVSSAVLAVVMIFYRVAPTAALLTLPLFLALGLAAALGVGLWFAALNVKYRDVQYVLPFIMQLWLFASPVAYSATMIRSPIGRALYALNPLAGAIQGARWALVGSPLAPGLIWPSVGVAAVLLVSGVMFFKRMEDSFADVI